MCVINFGLEYIQIYERSIDIQKFIHFINGLRKKLENEKIALFLDNMRVHHSKTVKKLCNDMDIPLVYNMAYSPEYNPIENVFSIVKNSYKRMKLSIIASGGKIQVDNLIQQSFKNVKKDDISYICRCGYE